MHRDQLAALARAVPRWWHSIDLGQGVVTDGWKTAEQLRNELACIRFPDLHGKSVLDIGAFDGFFSFEAERRGAARVVALDHYAWALDVPGFFQYYVDCCAQNTAPQPTMQTPYWQPDTLPGKAAYDTAHRALGSKVETVVADFMGIELAQLGRFDIVLYLGVLYHMEDPLRAMRRVAAVTQELAIIETEAVVVPGFEPRALWEFFPANELANDVSNWWAPNEQALNGLCNAAGFRRVATVSGPPQHAGPDVARYRLYLHAFK